MWRIRGKALIEIGKALDGDRFSDDLFMAQCGIDKDNKICSERVRQLYS